MGPSALVLVAIAISLPGQGFARRLHLVEVSLALEPLVSSMELWAEPRLELPCFGCAGAAVFHVQGLALADGEAQGGGAQLAPAAPGLSPLAATVRQPSNATYIGDTWSLGKGRELSLHLTPNQAHCAPLMRVTF
jgi:hypothetical protein